MTSLIPATWRPKGSLLFPNVWDAKWCNPLSKAALCNRMFFLPTRNGNEQELSPGHRSRIALHPDWQTAFGGTKTAGIRFSPLNSASVAQQKCRCQPERAEIAAIQLRGTVHAQAVSGAGRPR